jgi:hypothetical protein
VPIRGFRLALVAAITVGGCSAASDRVERTQEEQAATDAKELPALPPPPRDSVPTTVLLESDSIVLTRTICFGPCPAYRVRVARTGAVHYFSSTHEETRTDSIAPGRVSEFLQEIVATTFFEYPLSTVRDPSKCRPPGTDAPGQLLELFVGVTRYYVTDDVGCFWNPDTAVAMLRSRSKDQLAVRVDSVAGTGRWVRPRF